MCQNEALEYSMPNSLVQTLRHNIKRALAEGNLREAEEILGRLKKEDPLSLESRGFELELYLNSNRLAEADALAPQLCRLFPESARIMFLSGKLAYRRKHYEEAENLFRESVRMFPHWSAEYWLGKTLTQLGKFKEAESLLSSVLEHNRRAMLDLAWLHERRNDLPAAIQAYESFLAEYPGHKFAAEQQIRLRARMLEPEELIAEMGALTDLDEEIPPSLLPELVQKLFETGQSPRAREEILARLDSMEAKTAVPIAWICYRARAYDLACTLFLAHLESNKSNYKYLAALESAADKCRRLPEVVEIYRRLLPGTRQFYGRLKSLTRKCGKPDRSEPRP
jgi:tetratricopeptide (TPR) repeat protein